MGKVVYNSCFGGFSLSREAVLLARELSGNPKWGGACIAGDVHTNGEVVERDYGHIKDVPRNDQHLAAVVERLGDKADGYCAKLAVEDLPDGTLYRIDEYDGNESVVIQGDDSWSVA